MKRTCAKTKRRRGLRAAAIAGAVILLSGGCGARLTEAQMAALNSSGSGSGSGSGSSVSAGSGAGNSASNGGSVANAAGSGSIEGGSSTAVGSGKSGSTSSGSAGSPSSGSSSVSGESGPTSGGAASSGSSGGSSGSGQTLVEAGNPLAGPGGKVCKAGAPGSGPGVTSSTITIGNISTINGPVPGLFAGARYGTQAVADYINSIGGLCGRKVAVTSADDQFDQATDQNEASSMANSILAFVGSFSLDDAGIPGGAASVPDIGQAISSQRYSSPTNFSPQPQPPGYYEGPYMYLKSDPQYATATQHMALLVEDTPQTATTGAEIGDMLKSLGYKFVFTDSDLQPTDPTFNGDVQKMKAAGVTGVVFQATGTIIGQLANAMYQAGMKITLGIYCPAAYDPAYIKNAGAGTQGTILEQTTALFDGEDASAIPMVATLDQWYSRVNPGQVPDLYATYAWMSGLLFAEGINEGGAATRTALLSGLKSITSFNAGGLAAAVNPVAKTPPACWVLVDVQNGKFVRDPATPSGFRCSPSGYYKYTG